MYSIERTLVNDIAKLLAEQITSQLEEHDINDQPMTMIEGRTDSGILAELYCQEIQAEVFFNMIFAKAKKAQEEREGCTTIGCDSLHKCPSCVSARSNKEAEIE